MIDFAIWYLVRLRSTPCEGRYRSMRLEWGVRQMMMEGLPTCPMNHVS